MKLYGALRPLLVVSKFLGLFAVLKNDEDESSTPQDLYSCLVFLATFGTYMYLSVCFSQRFPQHSIREVSEFSQTLGKFLCYSLSIPMCILKRKKLSKLVTKIRDLDAQLGDYLTNYTRLYALVTLKLVLGLVASVASNLKGLYKDDLHLVDLLYVGVTDFFIYAVLVIGIQFVSLTSVTKKFFEAINIKVLEYDEEGQSIGSTVQRWGTPGEDDIRPPSKAISRKSEICPVPRRFQVLECQLSEFGYRAALGIGVLPVSGKKTPSWSRATNGIKTLMKLQDEACDIAELTNSVYSLQLLASLAVVFVTLTVHTYAIVISLIESRDLNMSVFFFVISVLFQAVQLLWLTYACSSTKEQANRTAVLVHKLLSKTKDADLKEELQMFSLQLLHRKVQFTACGFFPLDFTLLYSIVGAVTTYLVILIQFQLSFNSSTTKTSPPLNDDNLTTTTVYPDVTL